MTAIINKNGYELIECISLNEHELINYEPLAGSYAVVRYDGNYLICFNTWRKQWEVPAGGRNDNEMAKECAIRELFEETAQVVQDMDFKGLLKVGKPDGTIKYNPIFYTELDYIVPFKNNNETDRILFWNLTEDVGYIDEVDEAVLKWCKSIS
ncbi:NUDIX domain-containing protein [Paenibacillus anseongensis]|uniref:NUDIX domain-containing protein n=1 Tax=Paenibacillus TaxID=44249 RepID=UPI001FE59C1E|nr:MULTISPECIES: NUDIX hydrolase [Paenibacillus]